MRLLVTRPEPDAAATAERLERLGHSVLVEPLTRIEFRPAPEPAGSPAAIAFTSRNGVRAVARWGFLPIWRTLPVFAVGESTGALASDLGFEAVTVGQGDAAGLADLIATRFDPARGAILHVCGHHRTLDLAAMLEPIGIAVHTVEGYEAVAVASLSDACRRALSRPTIDGALFFSRRAASVFRTLVGEANLLDRLDGVALYAISERAAEPLRRLDAAAVRVSKHPDEPSLVALLEG
ncbi:uroporphyrinogen-III synthase [Bauldia sp.]|uniref:uroporphyrinogen-III synthase n=1 Tax=Bauldia sp. TaxID=2575872 RepID=UPI003BA94008